MKITDHETEELSTSGPLYITIPVRPAARPSTRAEPVPAEAAAAGPSQFEEMPICGMSEKDKMAIRRAMADRRSTQDQVLDEVVDGLMAAINQGRPKMRLSGRHA